MKKTLRNIRMKDKLIKLDKTIYRQFLNIIGGTSDITTKGLYGLFKIALLAIIFVFIVNLFSIGTSSFGEWGDFFGGVLNPVLTFLTFMGLLITIVIQQTELKEARKEFKRSADALQDQNKNMKKQNFENTFFQMLSLHNDIVNSIDLIKKEDNTLTTGRDCIKVFYTRLAREYRSTKKKGNGKYSETEIVDLSYKLFWKDHQTELGHYFRYLFNIIRFIEESDYSDGLYIKLIRAQLSDQELLLLFYNALTEQGKSFKPYVYDFSIFDNLPKIKLLDKSHESWYEDKAYDSALTNNSALTGTENVPAC